MSSLARPKADNPTRLELPAYGLKTRSMPQEFFDSTRSLLRPIFTMGQIDLKSLRTVKVRTKVSHQPRLAKSDRDIKQGYVTHIACSVLL